MEGKEEEEEKEEKKSNFQKHRVKLVLKKNIIPLKLIGTAISFIAQFFHFIQLCSGTTGVLN